MKITAGPARVIKARAAKLEIRWKSIPMDGLRQHLLPPDAKPKRMGCQGAGMPL